MKLCDARPDPRWIKVPFGQSVLNVQYVPIAATPRELMAASSGLTDQEKVDRSINTMLSMVVDWDLTENDDITKIPLTHEALTDVPMSVFIVITSAIQADQNQEKAVSPSRAG